MINIKSLSINVHGYFIGVVISILSTQGAYSCSCWGPDKFMESIGNLILDVEVLDVVSLDTSNKYAYSVTVMEVKKVMKGNYESDTLFILNDKGFECFHTVSNKEKGSQYILTGNLIDEYSNMEYRVDTLMGQIMALHLCGENILELEGNRVKGHITKNKANKVPFFRKIQARIHKKSYDKWFTTKRQPSKREQKKQNKSIGRLEKLIAKTA